MGHNLQSPMFKLIFRFRNIIVGFRVVRNDEHTHLVTLTGVVPAEVGGRVGIFLCRYGVAT